MSSRLLLAVVVVFLAAPAALGAGMGPDFLVRLDLNRQTDFDHADEAGVQPIFRWGNEFYAVINGEDLDQLEIQRVPLQIIETVPLALGYYYVDMRPPFSDAGSLARIGARALDQIGGATLWKSDMPLNLRSPGESVFEMTRAKIPLVYLPPLSFTASPVSDPILDTLIARISQDSVLAYGTRLMNFSTRYTFSDSNIAAQEYLRQKFLSFGYTDVRTDTFSVGGPSFGHNIICRKPGIAEPDKVIVIGGHYDSVNGQTDPMIFAPGADDNGSGTTGILEIARVLAGIPTRKTIIFVPFAAEEQGLVGSSYFAGRAWAAGTDIELMINMDMIAYNPDDVPNVGVGASRPSLAYAQLAIQLADSKTTLQAKVGTNSPGSSDHMSFAQHGYHSLYAAEGDFNYGGWHTNADLISRNNVPYWTEVIRMVAMTGYVVALSPSVVTGVRFLDAGDGRSLQLQWTSMPAPGIVGYRVFYGTASGVYTDTLTVPSGKACSTVLSELTEGVTYYAAVTAVDADGRESVARMEASMSPQLIPRSPDGVLVSIEYQRIDLRWNPNPELDLDHYVVYKGTDSTALSVLVPATVETAVSDSDVAAHTRYFYRTVAADHDGNLSTPSAIVSGIPATFDGGILIVDLTQGTGGIPSEAQQSAVYTSMFARYQHGYYQYTDYAVPVDRSVLGQYGTIFWINDGVAWKRWPDDHWAKLNWYMSYGMNVVVAGWQIPSELGSQALDDLFRISSLTRIDDYDCIGGNGVGGFPTVVFDTSKVYGEWNGAMPQIWTMTAADSSAQIILKYKSSTGNSAYEALPVAVRRDNGANKLALVGVPLYYLRNADGAALVSTLADWFGLVPFAMGDINGDGGIDAADVRMLISAVFSNVQAPTGLSRADVNSDCIVNILDIVYLINHVYLGGPGSGERCAR